MFEILLKAGNFLLLLVLFLPLFIISVVFITPVLCVLLLYRLVVWLMVRIFRRDLHSFITGLNANFTSDYPERANYNIIVGVVVAGTISSERTRQLFQERVLYLRNEKGQLVYQRLQQSWTYFMGYAFWRNDPLFELSNHIRDYDYAGDLSLPEKCTEQVLTQVWSKLATAPWKSLQSPWEVLTVPEYYPSGKTERHTLIIFRVNHIHCDAYSIVTLFRHLYNTPMEMPKPTHNQKERTVVSIWERLKLVLAIPYNMAEFFRSVTRGRVIGGLTSRENTHCSISSKIHVDDIKSIKNAHNVGYSTVVYSAVLGAVAQGLKNAGRDPQAKLDLAYVLLLPNHPGGWSCHTTVGVADMPCYSKSAKERLHETQRILMNSLSSSRPASVIYFARIISLIPTRIIRKISKFIKTFGPSCIITNFPPTLSKEYVDGLEMVDVFVALSVHESIGLVVSSVGVSGEQRFAFFLDKSIFGDDTSALKIAELFEQELETLRALNDTEV
ncbi:unnamed protein product [Allacma fusca]|uniref:O-acyltransferase WSD1 C-terminal domain-containing protein n=1 Tax=Allacma fusca TaxID=39272 RepID=A0A8J2JM13_9HEXA|nr:unnamed protein product [Allacma fusca]